MEERFNEFLDDIKPVDFEDQPDLGENLVGTGNQIEEEDESQSVTRFKSLDNSPPSLSSLCILRTCSWINEMTCDPSNNKRVHDVFYNRVKLLPQELQANVRSQLSMTALRCIYQNRAWDLDPHILASGIKQEEDMLRYLFWKQPNNPLLKHFEKTLVVKLYEDKKYFDLITGVKLPPTDYLKQSLVQAYCTNSNYNYVPKDEFIAKFNQIANGCLKKLNWNNVLVVGGSVLRSLRQSTLPETPYRHEYLDDAFDIDIYLYGLTNEQAQAKEEIFNSVQSCWEEKVGIVKTANTLTLVASPKFRCIQIILSTYASPLEILLASDMNSCSIGFNGTSVLVIPRFLFGAIYGSNFLDSSTKFGTKLRWERVIKYYKRGYNMVAPLYLRVHGYGSFNSSERITSEVHPNTYQMIELMCLMKLVLMRIMSHSDVYMVYKGWSADWPQGMHITYRTSPFSRDFERLTRFMPHPPPFVRVYYEKGQNLRWLRSVVRLPSHYDERYRTVDDLKRSEHPEQNFDPAKTTDIHKYVQDHCKFDKYNNSALQCFHLNFFVGKEQTVVNPYREMNTSLVAVTYRIETVQLTFNKFNDFLRGGSTKLTRTFKLHNVNWKFSLTWCSNLISVMSLTKESDKKGNKKDRTNDVKYRPTKFFANFLIKVKNQKKLPKHDPKDLIYDGSHVFTYMSPDDTWLTWVHNSYFKGMSVSCSEYNDDQKFSLNELDNDLQYIDKRGDVAWEITMQLIEPNFNLITQ